MSLAGHDYGLDQRRRLDRGFSAAEWNASNMFRSANAFQLRALKKIPGSFDRSYAALGQQSALGAREINSQAIQARGGAMQDLVSSGLFNTTRNDAVQRSQRNIRLRSLAELDAHIAESRAALDAAKGDAIANQHGQIANTKQNYIGALAGMASKKSSNYASILYGRQGGLAGPLGALAGLAGGIIANQGPNAPKPPGYVNPNPDYSLEE